MKSMKERERIAKHRQAKAAEQAACPMELRKQMERSLSEAEALMSKHGAVKAWDELPEDDAEKIGYLTCKGFGEYEISKFPTDLRDRIEKFYDWDYWVATETGNVANSEPQFDAITLTPKTGGTYTDLSRNLLMQSTPDAEQLIGDDLIQTAANGIDKASLYGTGADGQPTGIANQTGINAPTAFAAAVPTFAEVIAMKSSVAVDNALLGQLGYAIEPAMQGSLQTSPKVTGHPVFIMDDQGNRLGGYKCAVSSQITSGDIFFGNWADLIIGFWGGLDLLADPYTLGLSGGLRLIVHQSCDVALRHPVSFAYNNDTA